MADQNDEPTTDDSITNRADLLNALRGKGWVAAKLVYQDREHLGFVLGEFKVAKPLRWENSWARLGSWTTGAGEGYRVYRGHVDGHLVDFVDASQWPSSSRDAFVAVHDSDPDEDGSFPENRGADLHQWRNGVGVSGYLRLSDVFPEVGNEQLENE